MVFRQITKFYPLIFVQWLLSEKLIKEVKIMKKELSKITKVLEDNNFSISSNEKQDSEYIIEFGQYTPLGEDWSVCLFYNGMYNNFVEKL